jgi:HD-GYP domain-containing protein (c-di-GMP phosphodiesterase class II)
MDTIGLYESRRQFESSFSVGVERIAFSEVISAFSFALDLTDDAVPGHAVRSCLLGMRIGWALGLGETQLSDLYYALLLKDIGRSWDVARMSPMLAGVDCKAGREGGNGDWTRPGAADIKTETKFAASGAWRKAGRLISKAFQHKRNQTELSGARPNRGADIVRTIGLSEQCADAIHSLHEHWDGSGYPERKAGQAIPLLARILGVAQHLDTMATEMGRERSVEALKERSGTWFDPDLVRIAVSLDRYGKLWIGCGAPDERSRAMGLEPGSVRTIVADQVDRICEAFGEVVDAKSSYTYRHSLRVTDAATGIGRQLGLPSVRRRLIYRAALLHDLGMRQHPMLSQQILERVPSFAAIAGIAGRHHEKLDGTGYPNQLKRGELSLEDRVLALADFYTGLSEDRPYRQALPPDQIFAILRHEVPHKFDPDCLEALMASVEQHPSSPVVAYASARRENNLLSEACVR